MIQKTDHHNLDPELHDGFFTGSAGKKKLDRLEQNCRTYADALREMSRLAAQQSPFCLKGCAHCCCHTFFTTKAEVDIITFHLLNNRDALNTFIENYHRREQTIEPLAELLLRCNNRGAEGSAANVEFYSKKIQCAFLANNECLVYEVRPLTCAAFVSIIPPRICALEPKAMMSGQMQQLYAKTAKWLAAQYQKDPEDELADVSRRVYLCLKNCHPL